MPTEFQLMWDGPLDRICITRHCIEHLHENKRLVHSASCRAGPDRRQFEKVEIEKMLSQKFIEFGQTEWPASIVFTPKKNGTVHFCVDYQKLNAITKRDSYPIPHMDKCMDSLGEAAIFSTLGENSGNWQVERDKANRDKTTFTSRHGLYRFIRMLFGLNNTVWVKQYPYQISAYNGRHTPHSEVATRTRILRLISDHVKILS